MAGVDKDGDPLLDTSQFITGEWSSMPVEYNTRDLLIYAVGIGCAKESRTGHDSNHSDIKYIYEQDPGFTAFPTYPVLLSQKGATFDIDTIASSNMYLGKLPKKKKPAGSAPKKPRPRLRFKGVRAGVDAERYIKRIKDIPVGGAKMTIRNRLVGVHKKGKNALTENESELVGEDGEVYYRFNGGGIQIGAYGFTDSGRTFSEKIAPPEGKAPDATIELVTTPEQAHMYRLSGDYNPLHIDPKAPGVKGGGFPAPILHGLCTLGHSARAVLIGMGDNDPRRFDAMKLRFAAPVIPGDTLVTKMWKLDDRAARAYKTPLGAGCERVVFTTEVKSSGKVVIANSFMDLRPPPARM